MTERQSDAEQLIADLDEAISGPCQIPCDTPEVPGCRCGDLMLRVEAALRAAPPTTKPNGEAVAMLNKHKEERLATSEEHIIARHARLERQYYELAAYASTLPQSAQNNTRAFFGH